MHGRPRKPSKPADPAASAAKAENLRALQSEILHNHHHRVYTNEALEISSKLLEVNPEVYTAWNYRKLVLENALQSTTDPGNIESLVNGELRIVDVALRRNPKCYGAWHHRKWVLSRAFAPTDFDYEFRLLDQLLKADSRNFHGWNYRRFVAALKKVSEEEELKFMTDKINANFSNYSAWHNRSVLLSPLLKAQECFPKDILTEELELVHQALFTDPDDQSGWFYYLWLLNQIACSCASLHISSWPTNNSNLTLVNNKNAGDCISSMCSKSFYVSCKGSIPLVLYFSQAVKGVSALTVSVQTSFIKNEDLIWKPLSTSKSGEAHFWATYLKIPEALMGISNEYSVEVALYPGISSSCSECSYKFHFCFTLNYTGPEQIKGESDEDMVVWEDSNAYTDAALLKEIKDYYFAEHIKRTQDHEPTASKWHRETLTNEIALFKELLFETNSKIARLMVAHLLDTLHNVVADDSLSPQKIDNFEEILQHYNELMKMDPPHLGYYKDRWSLTVIDQVTSDKEHLAKHCYQTMALVPSRFQNHSFLCLSNLSLTRFGFAERLLWLQILDLSNNELKSIEGLEAMQFLRCLNLSHNRISSFTALAPLKLMASLEVLDISHNEIGSHSVDSSKYLCTYPLSHSVASCYRLEQYKNAGMKISDYWDAILLFQDSSLVQLDIVGNAAATDEFRMLIVKLIPTLRWLNGVSV